MKTYPRPKNFPYDHVFFDNGEVSLMCGEYKDSEKYSLGMRWNVAESELGYPNIFGKSMWMVVPDTIAILILNGLLNMENEEAQFFDRDLALEKLNVLRDQ